METQDRRRSGAAMKGQDMTHTTLKALAVFACTIPFALLALWGLS